eukprot:TRINITY_DN9453_c0_g1_i1.p1 TRINITY_DN9453_c0_g1~~TRINITY_DN9453_c0_g1_i1.p1  ORF type:complete len:175 (+),score=56.78 TRINITY_DN9453_c0_g1_i1:157-681(+)
MCIRDRYQRRVRDTQKRTMEAAAAEQTEEQRREEIMARLEAARASKLQKEADMAPDMSKYGTHKKITCDGCGTEPIVGYRWRCRTCKNHDLCDMCFEQVKAGFLPQLASQQRLNPVSAKLEDHEFFCHAENGAFSAMNKSGTGVTAKQAKKVKPNDPCSCGSGKKHKKCCQNKE